MHRAVINVISGLKCRGVFILYGFLFFLLLQPGNYTYWQWISGVLYVLCGWKVTFINLELLLSCRIILILWVNHLYYRGVKILVTAIICRS